nr:MAG TPA: hypothetical protein [Caudoviricetes sp.]
MKVSKKKIVLYLALGFAGLAIREYVGWNALGSICMIFAVCRLSEINGFLRGYRAAFSGEKE